VGVIVVDVNGLRNSRGEVLCYLYANATGFPQDPARAVGKVVAPIVRQAATCQFKGVAPGAYAVAVVHDENGNGRLDRNMLGIPTEGVGASNNPVSHFGPPKFDAARFDYGGGDRTLSIQLRYL
jgi:uncharacterized protein (DUF2141 family)